MRMDPRAEPGRPLVVLRASILRRCLPLGLVLPALPLLGWFMRPDLFSLFVFASVLGWIFAMPYVIQALRLLRFPAGARIFVLPGLYVVFVPHVASVS